MFMNCSDETLKGPICILSIGCKPMVALEFST